MALKINTNIKNDVNEYLIDDRAVKGGYKVVAGIDGDTKENLPAATLVEGTLVYDANEQKSYRYTGDAWEEESSGGVADYNDLENKPIIRRDFLEESVARTIAVTFDAEAKSATLTMNLDTSAGEATTSKTVVNGGLTKTTLGGLQIELIVDDAGAYYTLSVSSRNSFYLVANGTASTPWDVYMYSTIYGAKRYLVTRGTEDISFDDTRFVATFSPNIIYQYSGNVVLGTSDTIRITKNQLYGWTTSGGLYLWALTEQAAKQLIDEKYSLLNPSGRAKIEAVDTHNSWNAVVVSATSPSDIEAGASVKFVVEGSGPGRLGYTTTLNGASIDLGKDNLSYSAVEYVCPADAAEWFSWLSDGTKYSGLWLGSEEAATVILGSTDRPYYIKGSKWDEEGWEPEELAFVSDIQANPTEAATESASLSKLKIQDKIYNISGGGGTDVEANPEAAATDTVNTIKVGETVYNILPQAYKDYLDEMTFKKPEISTFQVLNASGTSVAGTYELGTTVTVAKIKHKETNITNINGKLSLGTKQIDAASTDTTVSLDAEESVTATKTYTLSGTDTRGGSVSKTATLTFNRYAYSKLSIETTAPTTSLTKEAEQGSFKSNGKEFTYAAGQYLYIYLTEGGKQAQTNVLGQWVDVTAVESGPVEITQANGATYNYYTYKIGPFTAAGSAKYRVK